MPSVQEHIKKARYNEGIAKNLIIHDGKYLDWAVITLFYSAHHYVDAYLAHFFATHHTTHFERRQFIANTTGLSWKREYYYLYNQGSNARYSVYTIDYNKLSTDVIPKFEYIKNTVLSSVPRP